MDPREVSERKKGPVLPFRKGVRSRQLLLLKGAVSFSPRKVRHLGWPWRPCPTGRLQSCGSSWTEAKGSTRDKGALTSVCSREQMCSSFGDFSLGRRVLGLCSVVRGPGRQLFFSTPGTWPFYPSLHPFQSSVVNTHASIMAQNAFLLRTARWLYGRQKLPEAE